MDVVVLAALAEPNRLRMVELLGASPRTVGEIAAALELRQPQVSKHVQTLERAGVVVVHPLGRRRVCALRRPALDQLSRWADGLAAPGPDDAALARYTAAIASADLSPVTVRRTVRADRTAVWRAFTDPALAVRWWHPHHFTVAAFGLDPHPGGDIELVLREGDGAQHHAHGKVLSLQPPRRLEFTLDPLDHDGSSLFTARHDVELGADDSGTHVRLTVTPSDLRAGAETAVAGLGIGWEQLLDNLASVADRGELSARPEGGGRPRRS